ncbi:MAG: tRNA (adenosine(37)-N6)-threonylcarbamoyltransferase complex ATPase subunit type 1 TsaE [Chitinophagales bacterium]
MKTDLLHITYSLEDIEQAVKQFWEKLHTYNTFAFSGEMGAGKTTFIHKLCDYLHVQDTVSSPTFALINEYHFTDNEGQDKTIYHLDWYRLRDRAETIHTGMEDCIEQAGSGEAYCFIEWPEKAKELLHTPYLWITIEAKSPTERDISVKLNG